MPRTALGVATITCLLLLANGAMGLAQDPACSLPGNPGAFDLDSDSALPWITTVLVSLLYSDVSEHAGDAPLLLRAAILFNVSWFDATAPFHETAVGVYSRIPRMNARDATVANINTALIYATARIIDDFLPGRGNVARCLIARAGLDPDDDGKDTRTAVGIGNAAGAAVAAGRAGDGMNQHGDEVWRQHNPTPYADYTNYRPVNTAYHLADPSRWQPDIQRKGIGLYKVQQFVTPQYALVEPMAYSTPTAWSVRSPRASDYRNIAAYKRQADRVLKISAELNDRRKMTAEFFDNKLISLAASTSSAAKHHGLSVIDTIHLDFVQNTAAFDSGIFVWQEKRRHDAVRPFSAIRRLYGSNPVLGWGGPGKGTRRLPASEWIAYIEEADHPEYPSASACFCAAHAQAGRRFLDTDEIHFTHRYPAGSSRIEPGLTPARDLTIEYRSWTDFSQECGDSRVWGGVHFEASVRESRRVCDVFGDMAYEYGMSLIGGAAPQRSPARGAPPPPEYLLENR